MSFKDLITGDGNCSGSNNPLNKLVPHLAQSNSITLSYNTNNQNETFKTSSSSIALNRADSGSHSKSRDLAFNEFSQELDVYADKGLTNLPTGKTQLREQSSLNNTHFAFDNFKHRPMETQYINTQLAAPSNIHHNSSIQPTTFVPNFRPLYLPQNQINSSPANAMASTQSSRTTDRLHNVYTNDQWSTHFEKAQLTLQQNSSPKGLSATAGEIINKLNSEDLPKLKNSSFVELMKKIRDHETSIENNDFVSTKNFESEETKNIDIIDPLLRQEMSSSKVKETLTDLSDEDYEHAYKFDNWVNQYEDEIMTLNNNPQNLDWDELRNQWESNMNKANNPLYDHYVFADNNKYNDQSTNQIEKAMQSINLNESLLAAEAMVKTNSKDSKAWYQLGIKQQENEREPSAIAALRQAVELDVNQYEAWLALAVSYTNENCRSDAYESLSKWLLYNPKYKSYHSDIIFNKNDNNQALHDELLSRYLDAINQSSPKNEFDDQLQVALGVLLNLSNDYDKAIECFQTALQSRPRDYLLWNKLGATYANNHQPEKAIEAYFKALEINPNFIRARYNLAISSINLSQYNEAAEHLVIALSLQKQHKDDIVTSQSIKNSTSTHIWDTLRMTLFMLNRQDLLNPCDNKDLEPFRQVFGV